MKVSTFHRLCILVALVLGLVCAWSNAVPKVTSGDIFRGGCYCRSLPDWDCTQVTYCWSILDDCDMNVGFTNSLNCKDDPEGEPCEGFKCNDDRVDRNCL